MGWTEKLGGINNETAHITTEVDEEAFETLKEKIQKCNTVVEIDTVVSEQGLHQIKGLTEYLIELYSAGNLDQLKIDDVNKFALNQRYTDIAAQAHGFLGVKKAINEYNESLEENKAGVMSATANTNKLVNALSQTNPILAECMKNADGGSVNMIKYAGSLVTATAKSIALNAATAIMNIGISTAASFIVSKAISVIADYGRKQEEARQKAIDASNASIEQTDQLEELYVKYQQLSSIQNKTDAQESEYKTTLDNVTKALGNKASALKNLKEGTEEYNKTLEQMTRQEFKETWGNAKSAATAAEKELRSIDVNGWGLNWWNPKNSNQKIVLGSKYNIDDDAWKIIESQLGNYLGEKELNTSHNAKYGSKITVGLDANADISEIMEFYTALGNTVELMSQAEGKDLTQTTAFQTLNTGYKEVAESMETYTQQQYASLKYDYLYQNGMPNTIEDFNQMKSSILEASGAGDEYKKVLADMIDLDFLNMFDGIGNGMKEFMKLTTNTAKEIGSIYNQKELSNTFLEQNMELEASLSSLKSEYESVSEALNQYAQDGSLSAASLDALLSLSDDALNALMDENGQISLNCEAWDRLTLSRLDEMKASVYQNAALELTRITGLSATEATNELARANGTLSQTAYEAARAELAKVHAMRGAYAQLGDNVWNAAQTRINLINKQIENVGNHIYSPTVDYSGLKASDKASASSSSGGSMSASTKQINFLEYRLKELDQAIDLTKAHLDNFIGAPAKNIAIDALIKLNARKQTDVEKALSLYQGMADELFNQIPAQYKEAAKNGAIAITDFIEASSGNDQTIAETIEKYRSLSDQAADYEKQLVELNKTLCQLSLDKFNNILEDYNNQTELVSDSIDNLKKTAEAQEHVTGQKSKKFYDDIIAQTNIQLEFLQKEQEALSAQMTESIRNGLAVGSDEWIEMRAALSDVNGKFIDCANSLQELQNDLNSLTWEPFDRLLEELEHTDNEIDFLVGLLEDADPFENGDWTKEGVTRLGLLGVQLESCAYKTEQYSKAIEQLNKDYQDGKYNAAEYTEKLHELQEGEWECAKGAQSATKAILEINKAKVDKLIEGIDKATDSFEAFIQRKKDALTEQKEARSFQSEINEKNKELADIQRQINATNGNDSQEAVAKRLTLEQEYNEKQKELDELQYEHSIELRQEAYDKDLENYKESQERKKEELSESLNNTDQILEESLEAAKENSGLIYETLSELGRQYNFEISETLLNAWQSGENALASYGEAFGVSTSAFIFELENVRLKIYENDTLADSVYCKLLETFGLGTENLQLELLNMQNSMTSDTMASDILKASLSETLNPENYQLSSLLQGAQNLSGALESSAANANGIAAGLALSESNFQNLAGQCITSTNEMADAVDEAAEKMRFAYESVKTTLEIIAALQDQIATTKEIKNTFQTMDGIAHGYWIVDERGRRLKMLGPGPMGLAEITLETQRYKEDHPGIGNISIQAFSKGGVIKKDNGSLLLETPLSTGDDTIIAAQEGERILTRSQNKLFEEPAAQAPVLIENIKQNPVPIRYALPDMQRAERQQLSTLASNYQKNAVFNTSVGSMLTVNGNVDNKETVKLIEKKIKQAQDKFDTELLDAWRRGSGGRIL